MAVAVGTEGLELGEVAKQARLGIEAERERQERKEKKEGNPKGNPNNKTEKSKAFFKKHWKKLAALGIILPVGGFVAYQGYKAVTGIQKTMSDSLAAFMNMLQAPLKMFGGLGDMMQKFSLENIKLPEFKLPEFTAFEFPKIDFKLPELPEWKFELPTAPDVTLANPTTMINDSISKVAEGLSTWSGLFKEQFL